MNVVNNARIIGPIINPITPNAASPPNTPSKTRTGWIFALFPMIFGFKKLSARPTIKMPHTINKMPLTIIVLSSWTYPLKSNIRAAGNHTIEEPK